ncbi:MAG: DUF4340 domain-containing protein [Gammaproteobacteria bacterium]|nr:DUF4340 domain-containing protein [Gammaproteobacteria bacterium]
MKLSARAWLNLGLSIAVAVLISVAVLEPGKKPIEKVTLSKLDKKTLNHIRIQRANQEDIVLEKHPSGWVMTAPLQYPANDFKVDSLLQIVNAESEAQYPIAPADLAKYGLDKPRASITFNNDQTFELGATEPLQQRRYLRYQNTLHLILDTYYYQLAAPASGFLDHALLPGNKNITKLVLPTLTVDLKDGKWSLQPAPKDYSVDQVTALLDGWRYAQAINVSRYDGKPLPATVKIYREGDNSALEFAHQISGNDLILIRNDLHLQFTLNADKRKDLLELPPKIEVNDNTGNKPVADKTPHLPAH